MSTIGLPIATPLPMRLTRAGFKVIEAATGKEALELSKNLPTVIVLDVKLPDILGYEVCRRIKIELSNQAHSGTSVIFGISKQ